MYLNCHTYYSLKYATFSVEELVQAGIEAGSRTLVLTDINNTSAIYDFYHACMQKNIRPVVGIEYRSAGQLLYTGIAINNEGFTALNRLLSASMQDDIPLPDIPPRLAHCVFVLPIPTVTEDWRLYTYDHIYYGVSIKQIHNLALHQFFPSEQLLIWHPVFFQNSKKYFHLHKLLRAIDKNTLLSKLSPMDVMPAEYHFVDQRMLVAKYAAYPHIIYNTEKLLQSCHIVLDYGGVKNRKLFTASAQDDKALLYKLAEDGLEYRYGRGHKEAHRRVLHELNIIDTLGYSAYFLITWDIIRYAQSRGYHHVGRGSGANSIVAYCLGITDVCPIELDLYFERFINPHRSSPPDFDIDFSWDERNTILDYIFKRYGKEYVAQIATYNTFKGSSIIRELGKVYGLPKAEIDALVDNPRQLRQKESIAQEILYYGQMMENFPNYLGIHAGGIIISEQPLYEYTALQMMPKGFPIVHWDMYVAEDIGFYKYDILSQRGLGHIKETVAWVRRNQQKYIDIHDVPKFKKDPLVRQQLKKARTIGCFYIESPAMRQLLTKLRCDDYLTLVAASSIIRPGVSQSGMMKQYIYRFHHPHDFEYLHPKMKELLQETYGVMVYQEDVIKVAHHFAGMDLADADVLRRGMSGKYRSRAEMQRVTDVFFAGCKARGYEETIYNEVWRQIESFSGYSFSKAHSASFAAESYQSLYLKTYFPLEFMVAVINNFGGFYRTEVYVHEARMCGATIEPPCINNSEYHTSIDGTTIYLGWVHLANLEANVAHSIVEERQHNGSYSSLQEFTLRVSIALEQLIILIRINAFRRIGKPKQELLWEAHFIFHGNKKSIVKKDLFEVQSVALPSLPTLDPVIHQQTMDEIALLGFSLTSPFDIADYEGVVLEQCIGADNLLEMTGRIVEIVGYLIAVKPVRTIKGDLMQFGCFIDEAGCYFDTVHFPDSHTYYPLKGHGMYHLRGIVKEEFGSAALHVQYLKKLGRTIAQQVSTRLKVSGEGNWSKGLSKLIK